MTTCPFKEEAFQYQLRRKAHWSDTSKNLTNSWGGYYRGKIQIAYRHLVPEGETVLELRCAQGDLLSALKPSKGVGVDFCPEALEKARTANPHLELYMRALV